MSPWYCVWCPRVFSHATQLVSHQEEMHYVEVARLMARAHGSGDG